MTSGGLGTMGYGLPAAVGVQMAHPDSLVIDIAGEASVQMTMQEMSTAVQYRLPIKIFILNNQYMGMVRQWQELLHGGRYSESYSDALPDFVKLAEAYRGVGIRCEKPGDLDGAIREMIDVDRPVIFDCVVDPDENCFPMIPSGRPHNEMILGDARKRGGRDHRGRQDDGVKRPVTKHRVAQVRTTDEYHHPLPGRAGQAEASSGTHCRCWSITSRACLRASSACFPAAATTSNSLDRVGDRAREARLPHHHRHPRHADGDRADQEPARAACPGSPGDRRHAGGAGDRARARA